MSESERLMLRDRVIRIIRIIDEGKRERKEAGWPVSADAAR
jgi:hypothetical protein